MISLKNLLLFNEATEYKSGDVIVGLIDTDNHRIYKSDNVKDHSALCSKFGIGFDSTTLQAFRYNKISHHLFFWTRPTSELKKIIVDDLKKDGYVITSTTTIDDYEQGSYKHKYALYHSHGGLTFADPDKQKYQYKGFEPIAEMEEGIL